MEGSSAFQFGRAAYRAGLMRRRQLLADGWANLRFRLKGASDDETNALRNRVSASMQGIRVRDLERLGADVLAGILPRIYPQVLAVAHEHQDAGRRVYIVTAASQELAQLLAVVLALDGAIGSEFSAVADGYLHGRSDGAVHLRRRQGHGNRGAGAARASRSVQVLRVLGLGVGPADAAGGWPSGRRQPGCGAAADRARRGLGRVALRAAGPAAEGRRRPGCGRRHRRGRQRCADRPRQAQDPVGLRSHRSGAGADAEWSPPEVANRRWTSPPETVLEKAVDVSSSAASCSKIPGCRARRLQVRSRPDDPSSTVSTATPPPVPHVWSASARLARIQSACTSIEPHVPEIGAGARRDPGALPARGDLRLVATVPSPAIAPGWAGRWAGAQAGVSPRGS